MDVQDFRIEVTVIQLHCEASSVSNLRVLWVRVLLETSFYLDLSYSFDICWSSMVERPIIIIVIMRSRTLCWTHYLQLCSAGCICKQSKCTALHECPLANIFIYTCQILNCIIWTACRQHITVNSASGCYIWAGRFTSTASSGGMLAFAHERCHVTAGIKVSSFDWFLYGSSTFISMITAMNILLLTWATTPSR